MGVEMNENEVDKHNENYLILADLELGFKELDDDKYECTKDQLIKLLHKSVRHAIDGTIYE